MNGAILRATVTDLHPSGTGIVHHADFGHIYIPFAFPGHSVEIQLREEIRPGHWNAVLMHLPDTHCAAAGKCGGCLWPGASYATQLEAKKDLFLNAARMVRGITDVPLFLHGDDRPQKMRSRVHLHANFFHGKFEFGFYARGARTLVAVENCPMASAAVDACIRQLAPLREADFSGAGDFGFGIEIIDLPEEDKVLILLYCIPERQQSLAPFLEKVRSFTGNASVHFAFAPDPPTFIHERFADLTLYTRAGCFQQVNRRQSRLIRGLIGAELMKHQPSVFFDLCSGSGNYSLPFHRNVRQIYGCDENPVGIAVAHENTERNGIANASYLVADAAAVLEDPGCFGWPSRADFIVMDPARQGMSPAAISALPGFRSKAIVYISNHTASFVRDARGLANAGLCLQAIHLVDFFPYTPLVDIVSIWYPDSV